MIYKRKVEILDRNMTMYILKHHGRAETRLKRDCTT